MKNSERFLENIILTSISDTLWTNVKFQKILVKIPVSSQVGVTNCLFFLLFGIAAVIILKHTIFQTKLFHFLRVILQGRQVTVILGFTMATAFVPLVTCRKNNSSQLGGDRRTYTSSFIFKHKVFFFCQLYESLFPAAELASGIAF